MKVLILSDFPFIGKGHKSGATVATQRVAEAVSKLGCKVSIYSSYYWGKEDNGQFKTIGRTKWDLIKHFDFYTLICMLRFFFSAKIHLRKRIIETLKIAELGYLYHVFKKDYDIIHSHDFNFMLYFLTKRLKRSPIFTIHGIFDGLEELDCPDLRYRDYFHEEERYERMFYEDAIRNNYFVTFVSSGLANHVSCMMQSKLPSHFTIIGNMIQTAELKHREVISIRGQYNIPQNEKILVCTGTVSVRKNQAQLVKAFSKLNECIKKKIHILIVGNDSQIDMKSLVREYGVEDRVHIVGFVYPHQMADYYEQADGVIVPSLYETFGMSIIEAYMYGLPVAVSDDLDAFADVYDEQGCVVIKNRSDEAICDAIETLISRSWDRTAIRKLCSEFSSDVIGKKYVDFYREYTKVQ